VRATNGPRFSLPLKGGILAVVLAIVGFASFAQVRLAKDDSPEASCGIHPLSIRSASEGYLLYFRYRVVEQEKARPLFDKKVKPYLVDQATGGRLLMPEDTKLGALRASPRNPPQNGKEYYVLFSNPARALSKGSNVAVVMGECKAGILAVD